MTLDEIERMMEITKRVREIRKEICYSIEDMSELLGIEPSEYLVLEAGTPSQDIKAYDVLLEIMETLLDINGKRIVSILESEHYSLSEEILNTRYKLGLSQKEMSNIAGTEYKRYIGLESCDLRIPVEEYEGVLSNIKMYLAYELFYKAEWLSQSLYESYLEHDINYELEEYENKVNSTQEPKKYTVKDIKESKQYKYSERLLDIRYDLELSQKEFVNLLDIEYTYYIRLECSDLTIPVKEYIKVVDKAEEIYYANTKQH